ncbi:Cysteine desulfurase [Croceitalea dokdonensis DOKDO 023]|uniref:cysteine desulfurase n=2 Tax=Croceitalea TaxID=574891 RepID=A0A0P7AJR5_9FLAO|nr:Cysteine desulfurase [Croceitalea dokdonensis DOKDO 023]
MRENYGNPSSAHSEGQKSRNIIEKARKAIARELRAKPKEIIFTSGGTEADNMILYTAVKDLGVETLITSKIEHHAVLNTCEMLGKNFGVSVEYVDLNSFGNIDYNHLERLLKADKSIKMVSLMHVNNEIGNITDIHAVGDLCSKHGAYFHSDTVQSIGHYKFDLENTPIDFLTASAHKFHGPKGVGFAYVRTGIPISGMIFGGSQESDLRAGTESLHNIAGMHCAFDIAYKNLSIERAHVQGLKEYFIEGLITNIPEISFNGLSSDITRSTYTLLNVSLPLEHSRAAMVMFQLDMKGIICSKGSACSSGSSKSSHVLEQILPEGELSKPSLRFSLSYQNTKEEIDFLIKELSEILKSIA